MKTETMLRMRHIAWVSALSIALAACGGGSSGGGGGTSGSSSGNGASASGSGGSVAGVASNAVGLVLDTSGQPVDNAVLGGGDIVSDVDGGAAGTLNQSAFSGWTKVSAPGYATAYAKPTGKAINGRHVFNEIRLTPIADTVIHDTSADDTLMTGSASDPGVKAVLGAGLFAQDGVVVQLAAMDPSTVGPAYAPLSDKADLHLNKAFFLAARDGNGNKVPFATGASVKATIRDDGSLESQFELASFNAEKGTWDVVANACQRADKNHLQCTVPHFSTWGLFGADSPPPSGDAYQQAYEGLRAAIQRMARHPNPNGGFPQYVSDAAAKLGQAALDYAAGHSTVRAIQRLLTAAVAANLVEMRQLGAKLFDAAGAIESKRAQALLNNTKQCARVRPLAYMATQALTLGDSGVGNALTNLIYKFLTECHVWSGTISYTFTMPSTWPTLTTLQVSGPHLWKEIHKLNFDLNPKTNQLQGDDVVRTQFGKVGFKRDDGPTCGGTATTLLEAYADPDPGYIYLTFDGTYDPTKKQFVVNTPAVTAPPAAAKFKVSPINLFLHLHHDDWSSVSGSCIATPVDSTTKTIRGYTSMLAGSFMGAPQGPSITEMMNSVATHQTSDYTIIEGWRIFNVNAAPGILPLQMVAVRWNFVYLRGELPPDTGAH